MMNWKGCGRKAPGLVLRCYPSICLQGLGLKYGLKMWTGSFNSGHGLVMGYYDHGNEPSGAIVLTS
jgi:hypothetical protein